jgi:hypothetical protein
MTTTSPGNDVHMCGTAITMFEGHLKFYRFGRWGRNHSLPSRLMLVKPMGDRQQLVWREIQMVRGVSILVGVNIAQYQGRSDSDAAGASGRTQGHCCNQSK